MERHPTMLHLLLVAHSLSKVILTLNNCYSPATLFFNALNDDVDKGIKINEDNDDDVAKE